MSRLIVVRHGQASFGGPQYDRLSSLGERQMRELARWWLTHKVRPSQLFYGPKQRHRQSLLAIQEVFDEAGVGLPEAIMEPAFDEHRGSTVVKEVLSRDLEEEDEHRLMPQHVRSKAEVDHYFRRFQEITRAWIRGEIQSRQESWQAFTNRVTEAIEAIDEESSPGETVVVITSGGPASITAGLALDLHQERVLELSWLVRNSAFVACLYGRGRHLTLEQFNATPHLHDPTSITMI